MARPPYSAQQRQKMFSQFVNAAAEIMETEGLDKITIRKVSQMAGYNSATLYNYFKDLDHLVIFASMKYFQQYHLNLKVRIADTKDDYFHFIYIWELFCDSAFEHPLAYTNLFFGKYSSELGEIIRDYYEAFPEELEETKIIMLRNGTLYERNMALLTPLMKAGYITEEALPLVNEIIIYCFKELLYQRTQLGERLDKHALIEKQIAFIRTVVGAPPPPPVKMPRL